MKTALLSTAYFPPISYFTKFFKYKIKIEKHENFIKQTYRNRMRIMTSNGIMSLTVPLKKKNNIPITDIKIDYSQDWQRHHLRTLRYAYNSSPFFIFLIEDLEFLFKKKYEFLWDLNNEILRSLNSLMNLNLQYQYTDTFISPEKVESQNIKDFRYSIRPKNPPKDEEFKAKPYMQVFSEKFGFISNLSILDLIFNTGLETKSYLLNSINL